MEVGEGGEVTAVTVTLSVIHIRLGSGGKKGQDTYGPSNPRSAGHQISSAGMKPRESSGLVAEVRVMLVGFQMLSWMKSA